MTAVTAADAVLTEDLPPLAEGLVRWLETGVRPDDLFAEDLFVDLSLPHWRMQEAGADRAVGIREVEHPFAGRVRVEALDQTSRGFLLQFEERWEAEGQHWYCRELIHCVVTDGRISELIVYCTGDWDSSVQRRHAEQVRLLRR
jgi:hypothetical protein